jgi:hypothetical protein
MQLRCRAFVLLIMRKFRAFLHLSKENFILQDALLTGDGELAEVPAWARAGMVMAMEEAMAEVVVAVRDEVLDAHGKNLLSDIID